ncbi:MAG: polysaccharide pyruvyl transferase family protein [Candidatus Latescibacterota bacterium]
MVITVLDTSVATYNQGNFIIMESIKKYLKEIFPCEMFFYSYTSDKLGRLSYYLINKTDYCFVGGTNLLSSNMNKFNQWKVNLVDSLFIKNIILMGVGWWQYQANPNPYTSILLKRLLHRDVMHSVRDTYTENKLKSCGFSNVINTSCPTLWGLDDKHCAGIPKEKADSVVFTITDYAKKVKEDHDLIMTLLRKYETVFFWPQGIGDIEYLKSLGFYNQVEVISASLEGLDQVLDAENIAIDYVGARLHSGIRALQKQRRAIILGTDNRAKELSKDFHIVVVPQGDTESLERMIDSRFETKVEVPFANIEKWKKQFQ